MWQQCLVVFVRPIIESSHTVLRLTTLPDQVSPCLLCCAGSNYTPLLTNMNSTSTSAIMPMMTPWLHFRGGDNLLFKSLRPSSKGAIAGACFVLIVIAVFERWVAATRGSLETQWRRRAMALISDRLEDNPPRINHNSEKTSEAKIVTVSCTNSSSSTGSKIIRTIPPFIVAHDIPRGAVQALQALLGYTLMLAVMTFHAAYLISIIVGLALGEVLFGRIGSTKHIH